MKKIFYAIKDFLNHRFNLHDDKAEERAVIDSIKKNVEFRGTNLWALIFAIFIASIGLNVNSTAVVIGAMLISPLMGPIIGLGLGIGINDLPLLKQALKNLLIAVVISIAASTLYFWITPLHEAQSELLARTTPSIWDVFIAFFGGLAGIVAGTRSEKTNVIPGVAIATALMPPLCTAGFGIAIGNFYYFIGAIYLFFINSVFICISTYMIVRLLRFHKTEFEDKKKGKMVMRYILIVVTITVLPSIYLAYKIVDRSIFEANANRYIQNEFNFTRTQIVGKTFKYNNGKEEIDLLLIGEELNDNTIDTLTSKLKEYYLDKAKLIIRQGLNAKQEIDLAQIKASILEDVYQKQEVVAKEQKKEEIGEFPDLSGELKTLYPDIVEYTISNSVFHKTDTLQTDTITLVVAASTRVMYQREREKFQSWLKTRTKADSLRLIVIKP